MDTTVRTVRPSASPTDPTPAAAARRKAELRRLAEVWLERLLTEGEWAEGGAAVAPQAAAGERGAGR